MNIFDKDFHGVDPVTGRPFSGGHPDGVWIISIIYSLFILTGVGLLGYVAYQKRKFGIFDRDSLIGGFSLVGLFLPSIVLMFRRSRFAFTWVCCLLLFFVVLACLHFIRFNVLPLIALPILFLQSYFAYYLWSIKKDGLLSIRAS